MKNLLNFVVTTVFFTSLISASHAVDEQRRRLREAARQRNGYSNGQTNSGASNTNRVEPRRTEPTRRVEPTRRTEPSRTVVRDNRNSGSSYDPQREEMRRRAREEARRREMNRTTTPVNTDRRVYDGRRVDERRVDTRRPIVTRPHYNNPSRDYYGTPNYHRPIGYQPARWSPYRHVSSRNIYNNNYRRYNDSYGYFNFMRSTYRDYLYMNWIFYPTQGYRNGYFVVDNYPYYIYNGYRHRYASYDSCNYQLVDSYNHQVVRNYFNGSCMNTYDQCAMDRDNMNSYERTEHYFCAETFRDQNYDFSYPTYDYDDNRYEY